MLLFNFKLLQICSFPHFSPTCFDILSSNFLYDFVIMYHRASLSFVILLQFLLELCLFVNLEYSKYTVFRTFLLQASQIARVRWPNIQPTPWVVLGQHWHFTLAQCDFAHRPTTGPTCWYRVGPMCGILPTTCCRHWSNTWKYQSSVGPMLDLCVKIDNRLAQCWLCVILYIGPTLARHYVPIFYRRGGGIFK